MKATTLVESRVECRLRDGVVLYADVYRPIGDGRHPVLLERTPYGRATYLINGMPLDPLRAAAAGFAVVIQDVRGRWDSEGDFYPFATESADGYDAVEWCATQSWSSGQVGMYGSSYMAATAWQAARAAPPSLVTMTPSQASSDYYEGRSYRGGVLELGSLLTSALLGLAPGSAHRMESSTAKAALRKARQMIDDPLTTAATAPLAALRETPLSDLAPFFFDWVEHDTFDEYWQGLTLESSYANIKIPVLHMTSWFDSFLIGSLHNYEGMALAGHRHQHLVIGPWTHHVPMAALLGSAVVGEMDCGLGSMLDFDRIQLRWFRSVFDSGEPPADQPTVMYFLMGANRWQTGETWPPPSTELRLYLASRGHANTLAGDGRLETHERDSEAESDTFIYDPVNPVPTLGGSQLMIGTSCPPGSYDQRPVEGRDDVLVFTSEPLREDLDVVGWVSATLSVASTALDTDFTAKLVDVSPAGRALNICDGARRLRLRESLSELLNYTPGEVCAVVIRMDATGHRFCHGHAIRLEVSSSNFPRFAVNPNTGYTAFTDTARIKATQTIFHSKESPSFLQLPVVRMDR